jgi:hypothetical protein
MHLIKEKNLSSDIEKRNFYLPDAPNSTRTAVLRVLILDIFGK